MYKDAYKARGKTFRTKTKLRSVLLWRCIRACSERAVEGNKARVLMKEMRRGLGERKEER